MKLQILFDIFLNVLVLDVNLHILSRSQNQIFIKLIKMFEVKSFQYLIDHTKLQGTPFVNVIFNYKKVISMNIHIYLFIYLIYIQKIGILFLSSYEKSENDLSKFGYFHMEHPMPKEIEANP